MKTKDWRKIKVTATGVVAGISAGDVFGGIIAQVAGTSTTITAYDDSAATAANLIIPTTSASTSNVPGAFISPFGGAVGTLNAPPPASDGLVLTTGLYITLGGTGSPAVWVLIR